MNTDKFELRQYRLALCFMLLAVAMSWVGVADRSSGKYVDDALEQALSVYAVARGINAVVSVIQSTSVGVSFFGEFDISPGEALDPFNDLVERYAAVMELSIGSLFTQKMLIKITSSPFFNVLLSLCVVAFIISAFSQCRGATTTLFRAALSLIFLRFAIVLAVLANSWVDNAFLQERLEQNVEQINMATADLDAQVPQPTAKPEATSEEESGMMDSIRNGVSGMANSAKNLMPSFDFTAVKVALDKTVERMVDLMAIFILKTLLLPLLFLYGLKRVFSWLWGWRADVPQARAA